MVCIYRVGQQAAIRHVVTFARFALLCSIPCREHRCFQFHTRSNEPGKICIVFQ